PSGLSIKRVFATIDERPAAGAETTSPLLLKREEEVTGKLKIKGLPKRDVTISVIAETEYNSSVPASINLVWLGGAPAVTTKPRFYALMVGVGEYAGDDLKLKTPANDAGDIDAHLKRQKGVAFEAVETRILKDSTATLQNIKTGLSWLRQKATDID